MGGPLSRILTWKVGYVRMVFHGEQKLHVNHYSQGHQKLANTNLILYSVMKGTF